MPLEAPVRPRKTTTANTALQSRGRWMIPAYKVVLFTSIGSSLYMMGRLVLVRFLPMHCMSEILTHIAGSQDLVRQELSSRLCDRKSEQSKAAGEGSYIGRKCTNSQQSLNQWHRFPLFYAQ